MHISKDGALHCSPKPESINKKRIMNYKLVQFSGIPKHLANQKVYIMLLKVLMSMQYFGQYGDIVNFCLMIPK